MKCIIFCFTLVLISCSPLSNKQIAGKYISYCILYNQPSLQITLKKDSTFYYKRPLVNQEITGYWTTTKDTVFLKSEVFETSYVNSQSELSPKLKNTDLENRDAYLRKGKKLFAINKSGVDKECYLELTPSPHDHN